ncbi:MAG: hypothetical protein IKW28_10855, partial [Lachnospiraceae bacterium]|nr:hypothetical protein [Lachnospiraceae bacterium]
NLSILSTQPDSPITFDFGAYLQAVEEDINHSENVTDTKNEEAASLVQDFLSEIPGQTYTGKAVKPVIRVYDNKVALKQNKDYKITYKNNINVNQVQKSEIYKEELPTIIIQGKGNYRGTVKINFDILPVEIGDGTKDPGKGIKLSFTDQLTVNSKKEQPVLKSISYKKAMKEGRDYELSLIAMEAYDQEGKLFSRVMKNPLIPKGSRGTFQLTIAGKGNFTGSIVKEIVVGEKSVLLKNAQITLGSKLKSIPFTTYQNEYSHSLAAGYYETETKTYYKSGDGYVDDIPENIVDKNSIYTVKCGNTQLLYGRDFYTTYQNDHTVGTATMTIHGKGNYQGTKAINFKLTGNSFSKANLQVEGLKDVIYTGSPITQEGISVSFLTKEKESIPLVYGRDYRISYHKNLNVGTATIAFEAMGSSGYVGKVKKTFKILPHNLENIVLTEETQNISLPYDKAGAKPVEEIILTNSRGALLIHGKDYTLAYKNNKKVAGKEEAQPPTIVVRGKGNYRGEKNIPFSISKASLSAGDISIKIKETVFNPKNPDSYIYKPSVAIKKGSRTLSGATDYTVEYRNNSQADYKSYYLENGERQPWVIIKAKPEGNYQIPGERGEIVLPIPIYQTKFTAKNIYAVISQASYTGSQLMPQVEVYYAPNNSASKLKALKTEEEIRQADASIVKLSEEEYQLEFGTNIVSGKDKGTVKIIGKSPLYGGSVTVKFTVIPRDLNSLKGTQGSQQPTDPTESTDPTEPTDPTDPTDPSEPTEPTDPTDPIDPTDPTEPTDPTDPSDPGEGGEEGGEEGGGGSQPPESTEPTEPTDPTDPIDPTDPTEPTDPTDPSDPGEGG